MSRIMKLIVAQELQNPDFWVNTNLLPAKHSEDEKWAKNKLLLCVFYRVGAAWKKKRWFSHKRYSFECRVLFSFQKFLNFFFLVEIGISFNETFSADKI